MNSENDINFLMNSENNVNLSDDIERMQIQIRKILLPVICLS